MKFSVKWMDVGIIILSEVAQNQKDSYSMFIYMDRQHHVLRHGQLQHVLIQVQDIACSHTWTATTCFHTWTAITCFHTWADTACSHMWI